MSKELTKKYSDKIIEVVYYDTIPDKETVCKVIYALINEYSDQQTKKLQENLYKSSTRADILQDENVKLQERVEEVIKVNKEWVEVNETNKELIKELQAKIDDTLKQIDELIENSTKNAQMFYESNNTTSQIGCDAMATAYNICKKLLTN